MSDQTSDAKNEIVVPGGFCAPASPTYDLSTPIDRWSDLPIFLAPRDTISFSTATNEVFAPPSRHRRMVTAAAAWWRRHWWPARIKELENRLARSYDW